MGRKYARYSHAKLVRPLAKGAEDTKLFEGRFERDRDNGLVGEMSLDVVEGGILLTAKTNTGLLAEVPMSSGPRSRPVEIKLQR